MTKDVFDLLTAKLSLNPRFMSANKSKPQKPVDVQLATFLMFNGGTNTNCDSLLLRLGVAKGLVINYRDCVVAAVEDMRDEVIRWLSDAEKKATKAHFAKFGFPDCVGVVDGSLISLLYWPSDDPMAYRTRQKSAGINIQVTCDHNERIIHLDIGWPGSQPDVTIWKQSRPMRDRATLLTGEEHFLHDKGV